MTSPYINRFLQPDSIIPNLYKPQSLNRFAYVLNNPVRFNDPTGHKEYDEVGGGIPCYPGEAVCQLAKVNYKPKPAKKIIEEIDEFLGISSFMHDAGMIPPGAPGGIGIGDFVEPICVRFYATSCREQINELQDQVEMVANWFVQNSNGPSVNTNPVAPTFSPTPVPASTPTYIPTPTLTPSPRFPTPTPTSIPLTATPSLTISPVPTWTLTPITTPTSPFITPTITPNYPY